MHKFFQNGRPHFSAGLPTVFFVVLLSCGAWSAAMAADERMAALSPENQALAKRMVEFMGQMDGKYFARAKKLNGELKLEDLAQATETDDYQVRVTRGPVVEKLGRMIAEGKKMSPGRVQKDLAWGRFYSLDFHARTPLVGMLHAVVVLQFYTDGTGFAGGWLGVMNGTRVEADMAQLKSITEGHFKEHSKDPTLFRKLIMKGTDDTVGKWRRRPDDSGVSFYGPPVDPDVTKSWEFISGLFDKYVDGYVDLIAKHAQDRGTEQDVRAQEEMRKRWLTDQLFSDPFSSKLVPFEVWSLSNVPPVVKF